MISDEIAKKIKLLHIKTNYLANDIFSGEYKSSFRGYGMEFEEVREYQPGDDVRTIDWNVTARSQKPFVKIFREERELTTMLLVDASASGDYGSGSKIKRETAAEVAAVLAFAAIKNNDKVGLMIFTDRVEHFIPPNKGKAHVYHVIKEILTFKPEHTRTNISEPLEKLIHVIKKRAVCFVISDFQDENFKKPLAIAAKRHDIICALLYDESEVDMPDLGFLEFQDPETGETFKVNTSRSTLRNKYKDQFRAHLDHKKKLFAQAGVDCLLLNQNKDYVDPFLKFFRYREKRI